MSFNKQNVQQDGAVVERRLRPIYEWLDNGNNKKALQEAEKVLKKSPALQTARALRALALLRLGRTTEGLSVLNALAAEKPSDDTTLQAMTISYRESQQLWKVCELYEAAVAVDNTSEDLYTQLFMAYVRVGDFRAQQQTALALYKVAPKNPYYFWAVMSIVLQAKEAEDQVKKGVLLSLAQRMIDKFITENKLEAQQETRIYIMILELQKKYEDILRFMESPIYSKLVPGQMPAATIPYLKLLGHWRELNTLCKELLWDNLDRWDYYEPYLESTFELMKSGDPDESPEKCHEFICQLIENIPEGRTVRGPYLARLELYKRLREANKDPEALMGGALELVVSYVRRFAHKACCAADVRRYVAAASETERRARARDLLVCVGMDQHTMPETLSEVQRHVSCLSVWRLADPSAPPPLAAPLRSHYLRALARGLASATLTEFPAADTYAALSARSYYLMALEQQSSAPILEALSLLEFVIKNSPSNFHCKLLALKLYHRLGNAGAADTHYNTLEVKHIQLSSLGWLHAARLQPAGLVGRALQLHSLTQRAHTHHTRDSVDHLTYSYKYGTFEKLCELMSFVGRVERCAWCAAAALERALLELHTAGHISQPPPAVPAQLSDNRDLTIMKSLDPPHLDNPRLQEETFQHELSYLQLRSSVVSAITLSSQIVSAVTDSAQGHTDKPLDKEQLLKDLKESLAKFEACFVKFKESYRRPENDDVISAPFPSRIIAFVNSPVPYRELYTVTLGLVFPLARGEDAAAHAQCERAAAMLRQSQELMRPLLRRGEGDDPLWTWQQDLEELNNYIELLSIVTFELGVCNEIVTKRNKRNKKKNSVQSPSEQESTRQLSEVSRATRDSLALAQDLVEQRPAPALPADLAQLFTQLTLSHNYEDPVQNKLRAGHAAAVADMKNIISVKMKALKSLL